MEQKTNEKSFFRPIENAPLLDKVIHRFKDAILTQTIKSGDKLPTENNLAKQFGVGRSTIREAVRILEAMGVLEVRRAEGIFVKDAFSDNLLDPLFYSLMLSQNEINLLKETAQWLDFSIISLAVSRVTNDNTRTLRSHFENLIITLNQENTLEMSKADEKFYSSIFRLSGNPVLAQTAKVIRAITIGSRRHMFNMAYINDNINFIIEKRTELFDAIINKKTERILDIVLSDPIYN